jgi:hypothetical protein
VVRGGDVVEDGDRTEGPAVGAGDRMTVDPEQPALPVQCSNLSMPRTVSPCRARSGHVSDGRIIARARMPAGCFVQVRASSASGLAAHGAGVGGLPVGSVMQTVAPPLVSLMSSRPPWVCTMRVQVDSPMP